MVNHMKAQSILFSELGWHTRLLLDCRYLDEMPYEFVGMEACTNIEDCQLDDVATLVIHNSNPADLRLFRIAKASGATVYFTLHEPAKGLLNLILRGPIRAIRGLSVDVVNAALSKMADTILLPSDRAIFLYEKRMRFINHSYIKVPLLFDDVLMTGEQRKHLSFIGNFILVHGSKEFISFMHYATVQDQNITFEIVTKEDLTQLLAREDVSQLVESNRLKVQHGRPLSNKEIDEAFQRSQCVWMAYNDSTQSGTLINAFRNATPVIATRLDSFRELIRPGINGEFVTSPSSYEEILHSFSRISEYNDRYVNAAKCSFINSEHYYKTYFDKAASIFGIGPNT